MESPDFFVLKSSNSSDDDKRALKKPSTEKAARVGYGGTLHQRLGRRDGVPVSVWSFSVSPGFKDDDRGVWVSHTESETVFVTRGKFHYSMVTSDRLLREEITVEAGDVLYVAPGTYHRGHSIGDERYEGLVFVAKGFDSEIESTFTEDSRLIRAKRKQKTKVRRRKTLVLPLLHRR